MANSRGFGSRWWKSSQSTASGCVEIQMPESDVIRVRDSKDPSGAVLTFNAYEWDAFVAGVRSGEFDRP